MDVRESVSERLGDKPREQRIAKTMTCAIGSHIGIDPASDYHIELLIQQLVYHGRSAGNVISHVAIAQYIDVGVNISEHRPHDIALTL